MITVKFVKTLKQGISGYKEYDVPHFTCELCGATFYSRDPNTYIGEFNCCEREDMGAAYEHSKICK